MPHSRVFAFTDPDAYQERIRASQAAILTLGRGEFRAALTHVDLDRMWMQWGFDSLPRIAPHDARPHTGGRDVHGRFGTTAAADRRQGADE